MSVRLWHFRRSVSIHLCGFVQGLQGSTPTRSQHHAAELNLSGFWAEHRPNAKWDSDLNSGGCSIQCGGAAFPSSRAASVFIGKSAGILSRNIKRGGGWGIDIPPWSQGRFPVLRVVSCAEESCPSPSFPRLSGVPLIPIFESASGTRQTFFGEWIGNAHCG